MKESIKTTTLTAQVVVSKMETGTNHVQVMPDDPCVGLVEAFRGLGYGQMLSTGTFEYTRHKRIRSQAVTLRKMPHSSVSRCKDGTHRFTLIVKDEELERFCNWLEVESREAVAFMRKYLKECNYKKKAA